MKLIILLAAILLLASCGREVLGMAVIEAVDFNVFSDDEGEVDQQIGVAI